MNRLEKRGPPPAGEVGFGMMGDAWVTARRDPGSRCVK